MNALPVAESEVAAKPADAVVAHKFGGSSVADAARYRHVAQLLGERDDPVQVTVVSAMKGVTDALIALADAAARNESWPDFWCVSTWSDCDCCWCRV